MERYWIYVPHNGIVESLMVVRSTFTVDSEEDVVRMCLGSGRVHNALHHGAGQCVKGATGVVRQGMIEGEWESRRCSWTTWSKTATNCRECAAHNT